MPTPDDLFTCAFHFKGMPDPVTLERELITSDVEAAKWVHSTLSLFKDIDRVIVYHATEAGTRDATEDVMQAAADMCDGGKAEAPEMLHPFIYDPDYDARVAAEQAADEIAAKRRIDAVE